MKLRSLRIENFRKFRAPLTIDGFTDGLNIVVEPNETGKSTLLEAMKAALFIRYSAKTELVRSFCPFGDDVAPQVDLTFELPSGSWLLEKQFLKGQFVRLSGPTGRRESDAAEDQLQQLLGFERGNNRGSDPETRGPLGMLWVEQASALSVEEPNRGVRDSVRGVLEAEVGAVTGGRRFDAIRATVEESYTALRTAKTGQSRGDLLAAETRLASATEARGRAEAAFRNFEQLLGEIEGARTRLKLVERDLDDPETVERRSRLLADLRTGESAQLRLATAEAQYARAEEAARTMEDQLKRVDAGATAVAKATTDRVGKESAKTDAQEALDEASSAERDARATLGRARTDRENADGALEEARAKAVIFARHAAERRAIELRTTLKELEKRAEELKVEAAGELDSKVLATLSRLEHNAIEARARFAAGAVRIEFELADGTSLLVDGINSRAASIEVVKPTRMTFGDAGSILVVPPDGAGRSIEAEKAATDEALAAALRDSGVASHAAAMSISERAAGAKRELAALVRQIESHCPGDPSIDLEPGATALRAYVVDLDLVPVESVAPSTDISGLERSARDARSKEASAGGRYDEARIALSNAELGMATAAAELAAAVVAEDGACERHALLTGADDRATLATSLGEAQRERARKTEALESAQQAAASFDVETIRRRIENADRASARAGEERLELARKIASLEATIEREGNLGPAGVAAEAAEEEDAATAARDRLCREADVLELLRSSLTTAADEASRTFLAPVTKRAARYVERLLPGCDLLFGEGLGLSSVSRSGVDEACISLSKGTQEQLAVLTRLAFADLLLDDGAPISLILDDPLVYSDDARLETMTDILQEASQRMQVILLTCRSKAFRHVEAHRIYL
jgi:hypothetical protein